MFNQWQSHAMQCVYLAKIANVKNPKLHHYMPTDPQDEEDIKAMLLAK